MVSKYDKLFEPVNIGKLQLKNRFAMAPMAIARSTGDWTYAKEAQDYYIERAKGGIGLIITGANFVDNTVEKHINGMFPCPTESPMNYIQALKFMADKIHSYGSKLFVQLTAGLGRSAIPQVIEDESYVAPSPTTNRWDNRIAHRALKTEEIYTIIKKFAESAKIVQQGGADGVEVHAVHEGYLMDIFTMAYFNHRTDEFGGDMMGRLKFPIETLKAVKTACGKDFPVSLRFSVKSYIKEERHGGLPGETFKEIGRDVDEGLKFAKILEDAGYDALNVDAGSYDAWYWAHPPMFFEKGVYLKFGKMVKETVKIPVLVAGRLGYPDLDIEAVEEGFTDIVELGRPLLADPFYVNKLKQGDIDDIRPCLSCHDGCVERGFQMREPSCAINPTVNREEEAKFGKADTVKRAIVVGDGPAGMESARVLALRGHKVKLYEKDNTLGGTYRFAAVPEFKDDSKLLIEWYKRQLSKLGVAVFLNHEITENDEELKNADVVITATGSSEIIPKIEGVNKATTAINVLSGKIKVNDKCTIVGAGQVGCETAIWLSQHGKRVTLIEMADCLMPRGGVAPMNEQMIVELLEHFNVQIHLNSKLLSIDDSGIVINKNGVQERIESGQVILSLGYRSNPGLFNKLCKNIPGIYNLGDSKSVANIMEAIWDAYEVCSHL